MALHLFGSSRIKQLAERFGLSFRKPQDIDLFTSDEQEYNFYKSLSVKKRGVEIKWLPFIGEKDLGLYDLYYLKKSHCIYPKNWRKHMSDIRWFQLNGFSNSYYDWFLEESRKHHASHIYPNYKRFDFNLDESKLFEDKVKREIPHDDLHVLVANKLGRGYPAYMNVTNGIIPSEEKWNGSFEELKNNVCFEEIYVLALERSAASALIYETRPNAREAYLRACELCVTRLFPLWQADYVIDNWASTFWSAPDEFINLYDSHNKGS